MHTILVVDDQPEIRRLLGITLQREFHVVEAVDGLSALEAVRRHQPAVVLLDVMMPGPLDGLGVLDRIRADAATRHIPVAMLTARGQAADRADAQARGANAYFTKPFSPTAVIGWVREAVAGIAAADDAAMPARP